MSEQWKTPHVAGIVVRAIGWFLLALGITFVLTGLLLQVPKSGTNVTGVITGVVLAFIGFVLRSDRRKA